MYYLFDFIKRYKNYRGCADLSLYKIKINYIFLHINITAYTLAQMAYLYFLYNKKTVVNTTEFSKVFGWNTMTSSRALNELYNAKLFTIKDIVDRASLYASLNNENDEKIGQALEEALREKKWYMD